MSRDQIARVLYAKWIWDDSYGRSPTPNDWNDFDSGKYLNPVGLTKEHFLEEADILLSMLAA